MQAGRLHHKGERMQAGRPHHKGEQMQARRLHHKGELGQVSSWLVHSGIGRSFGVVSPPLAINWGIFPFLPSDFVISHK